jgi:ADP-ribose pyrophosphatase YjhB (NUDIX family)
MLETVWKPNVTVAAIAEHDGRFLIVEEKTAAGEVYNQPAGHLEEGEGLVDAVVRETLEETARNFEPKALTGIYRWQHPNSGTTFVRFCFTGRCVGHEPDRPLDPDISRVLWLSATQLRAAPSKHRSPMVMRCVEDYLMGRRYPLELLKELNER